MRPRPAAEGIAVLAVSLGVYALLFDDTAGMAAAGVLALFLVYRAGSFYREFALLLPTVTVKRTTGKRIARQGSRIRVASVVAHDPGTPLSVTFEDIAPPVAIVENVDPPRLQAPGETVLRSVLRLMAAGDTSFGGLVVRAHDPFFSGSLTLRGEGFSAPSLRITPESIPVAGAGRGDVSGEIEGGKNRILRGQETRGYREYIVGDSLEMVDWKLSAKYGTMIVREVEGISGGRPFVIVDLPDRRDAPGKEEFARYSMSVNGGVEGTFTRFGACPLLIVSGAEILSYLPSGSAEKEILDALSGITPTERAVHLYRYLDPVIARSRIRAIERTPGEAPEYRRRLSGILSAYSGNAPPLPFREGVGRAIRASGAATVLLYSTFRGDPSHLVQIALEARRQGMEMQVYALGAEGAGRAARLLAPHQIEAVEEI
ncbi:DUF58 domain-containing protein [Methanofollis fontis]|uniref:DUF58 domain-containing protein n=1 Tax=Methanofollis fontis TaxID=2052832 RepID=A0A483CQC3_9EURY|nr:DUF58 domain-containing protein [Methanofollis fontis]TAJ45313.1 hypothetical protein CUJ86_00770 [Methanofollis fontis]